MRTTCDRPERHVQHELTTALLKILLVSFSFSLAFAEDNNLERTHLEGRVLVKLRSSRASQVTSTASAYTCIKAMRRLTMRKVSIAGQADDADQSAWFSAELEDGISVPMAIEALKQQSNVVYAEPDYICQASNAGDAEAATSTGDPYSQQQYALDNIMAPQAWDVHAGDGQLIVAVIDSGIDLMHEDLNAQLWINAAEETGGQFDGIDNDNNGYVDDLVGWNFVGSNANPQGSNNPSDDNGHGSHVAGIIAAVRGNDRGIAGMADVRIMSIKALAANGSGATSSIVNAVYYAIDNGARVINMSIESPQFSQAFAEACTRAEAADVVIIAATGNQSNTQISYPAGYQNVMAVGAVDINDNLADFSNTGQGIDLVAPGVDVLSCVPNGYQLMDGTSMASPYVAGVAAMIRSLHPEWNAATVRAQLRATADDLGTAGYDTLTGYGRLNAFRALSEDVPTDDPELPTSDDEFEENDTMADAVELSPGSYNLNGLDPDFFWLAAGRARATIEINGPQGDLDLGVLDVNGQALAVSEDLGSYERLELLLPDSGAYLVVLPYQDQTSPYQLTLAIEGHDEQPTHDEDRYEDNDELGQAQPITPGTYELEGWDDDWFALRLSEPGDLDVLIAGSSGDLDLVAIDENGTLLDTSNATGTSNEVLQMTVSAGTVYLGIAPFEGAGGSYRLTIEFDPTRNAPPPPADPQTPVTPQTPVDPQTPVEPQTPTDPETLIDLELPAEPETRTIPVTRTVPVTPTTPAPETIEDDPNNGWNDEEPVQVAPPIVSPCGFGLGFAMTGSMLGMAGLTSKRRRYI
jgi:subtilisin family serine protease